MDIKRMMSQMQNIQKQMDTIEVTSTAGAEGEEVSLTMNGKFKVMSLKIKFLPKDADELEILEDLMSKIFSDCHLQIEEKIKKMSGGMF